MALKKIDLGPPDRYAASVIMTITYGKTTPTAYSDPEVQEVQECLSFIGIAMRPGAYLVDSFPILKCLPGYTSELKARHRRELSLFRRQLDGVRKKMVISSCVFAHAFRTEVILQEAGKARPCFAKYLIEKQAEHELTDDEMAYLAGSMFGAGSDTVRLGLTLALSGLAAP